MDQSIGTEAGGGFVPAGAYPFVGYTETTLARAVLIPLVVLAELSSIMFKYWTLAPNLSHIL